MPDITHSDHWALQQSQILWKKIWSSVSRNSKARLSTSERNNLWSPLKPNNLLKSVYEKVCLLPAFPFSFQTLPLLSKFWILISFFSFGDATPPKLPFSPKPGRCHFLLPSTSNQPSDRHQNLQSGTHHSRSQPSLLVSLWEDRRIKVWFLELGALEL